MKKAERSNTFGRTSLGSGRRVYSVMENNEMAVTRRTIIKTGLIAVGGGSLAGCTSSSDSDPGSSGEGNGATPGSAENFDGWMEDVPNYVGVTDLTGQDEVTVQTGAQTSEGPYGFEPAAIRVSTGTNVVWEWTGEGSPHNVVDEGGAFESELLSDEGATFEHEFGNEGTFKYSCVPHESLGMKGVVVVA